MEATKVLTAIQVTAIELRYHSDVRSAYSRHNDNNSIIDYMVHFEDGTSAWIDGQSYAGLCLATIKALETL